MSLGLANLDAGLMVVAAGGFGACAWRELGLVDFFLCADMRLKYHPASRLE